MSADFLRALLQRLGQEPAVQETRVAEERAGPGGVYRVDLDVIAGPGFAPGLAAWTGSLPGCVYCGAEAHGWTLISADGVEWRVRLKGVFPDGGPPGPAAEDVAALAGEFWRDLYRAARAIRDARPLTAHRWLYACGGRLIDVYRAALAPGRPERGWEEAEAVPGLVAALEPVRTALAAPLDAHGQRRAAHRMGTAFEGLLLPLCERLGVAYPMALRNLAFQLLDAAGQPARPEAGGNA